MNPAKLIKSILKLTDKGKRPGVAPFARTNELIQTPAQAKAQHLLGRTSGNRNTDANLMLTRDNNIIAGSNLNNLIGQKRVDRAVAKKMAQRPITQKLWDFIVPGGAKRRAKGFYEDAIIPEVREQMRSIGRMNNEVGKWNTKAVNAYGDPAAAIEPNRSYANLVNRSLRRY
jgi:hypothetical protein